MTESERNEFDLHMMAIALRLAERGLGNVAPNPAVGAVIVDEATGEVVGRGWTQPGGRPHAETEAIARAGSRARGATLYVTLEPCSHHGKTGPCADAVIAAGIARVVCAIEDPDPRVAGRGLDRLRDAGIAVSLRAGAREADWVTKGHILRVSERRPMVWLKMAVSCAGEVPRGEGGAPAWVTGPQARAHGHLLRAQADAIVIGRGTLEDDDPELTCRLPGLGDQSPRPVILAGSILPDAGGKLLVRARESRPWLFVANSVALDDRAAGALSAAGYKISRVAQIGGRLWLPQVMEELVGEGVTRILVEGGPVVWRSFFEAGLVDAVAQYRGGAAGLDEADSAKDAAETLKAFGSRQKFRLIEQRQLGEDRLYVYRRANSAAELQGS